ncbi:MAG: acyl-CoA thioesterase [Anaerolineae bacterium]|nr:acyl-CoA thioesterase [Anaerolineae bacterium]
MTESPYPDFHHAYRLQVRWADLDALGHVNNATYLTYLEQARIDFFNALALWDGKPDKVGLIMARAVIDYKLPLNAEDDVTVHTRVARLGGKSFDTEQHVVCERDGQLAVAAVATITIVVYDYPANQSAAIPEEWRASLQSHGVGHA